MVERPAWPQGASRRESQRSRADTPGPLDPEPAHVAAALAPARQRDRGASRRLAAAVVSRSVGSHKGLRAGAVAGLARLDGDQAADWCAQGLRDPDDAVRLAVARELALRVIARCSSWRSTTRTRGLRSWHASSRPIRVTTCCGRTGTEAPEPLRNHGIRSCNRRGRALRPGFVRCANADEEANSSPVSPAAPPYGCGGAPRLPWRWRWPPQRPSWAGAGTTQRALAAPHRNAPQQVSWRPRRVRG